MDEAPDRFGSRRSTVYAPEGVVATSQPLAAQAGANILRDGGNAFDAAVATAAALNVVEPTSTGLGGDVFALYRTADGNIGAMRASGHAPDRATPDRVSEAVAADEGVDPVAVEMPERGAHTVTVPGTARGWEATIQRLGRKTLADALAPAIELASEGYPVSPVVATHWRSAEDLFTSDAAREAFLFDGHSPDAGQSVRLPRLAETMTAIAEEGADVVYEGRVGSAIAETVQAAGGFLTEADLSDFEVEWPEPISTVYGGAEVYELGPHNQGQIALEALNIAEEVGARAAPRNSCERVHRWIEAVKLAFHDGHHYITDPDFVGVPALHEPAHAAARARQIGEDPIPAETVDVGLPETTGEDADTVLLTVADATGNLVSFINSRFMGFGSGLVAGEAGIALQNRGASFSLDSTAPNCLEPGKRPFHTLIPGLVCFDGEGARQDWAAFGVMGGFMQPQGHVQVLSGLVDDGLGLQAALDAPRWRYRADGTVAIEERMAAGLATQLARRGHDVRVEPAVGFGGAQIARIDADDVRSGATEPRNDGHVAPL